MNKLILSTLLITATTFASAQSADAILNAKEAERINRVLASDEMRGRRVFTPELDKAADFIESEFKAIGLKTWDGSDTYRQGFAMIRPRFVSASATLDGATIEQKKVMVITCQAELRVDDKAGYAIETLPAGVNLTREAAKIIAAKKNVLVMVDPSHEANFARLAGFKRSIFKTDKNFIFILGAAKPTAFTVEATHEITEQKLANVVGVIPGKSKKDEYVIFSGHYDHMGVTAPQNGDSIMNGANDDAAGITAVIMLAKYFKQQKDNERTLIFAAFTAEEVGGYGSQYFSRGFDATQVIAMFNIEMIGTESKWGKNSAYITGFDKTDMGAILQKNLEGTGFTFQPDPYTTQNLFFRSDNATLARLGVPAHTISTAKMDAEPHYHKVTDHPETLDFDNMAMIIRSIALSSKTIVAGKDTPSRVNVDQL
jgi:Zn-dependent M28 family amino/carboxypeptidase